MRSHSPLLTALILLGLSYSGFSTRDSEQGDDAYFHSASEREVFARMAHRDLTVQQNDLFGGSGLCGGCHGHDPAGLAMVDSRGADVNILDDWRATMMANSSKDPLWLAKVSHEVLVNPGHQQMLEHKCTSCHAPMGHFNAIHNGQQYYSMAQLATDSLGLDGVSCGACHQLDPEVIGNDFSGNLVYDTTKTVWGPYLSPFQDPMADFIGFNVEYGEHIQTSELCAGCHTLITETVDLGGTPTGGEFVEQATYHEWLNSDFSDEITGTECAGCHVPQINENIIIAANYSFLGPRRPYGLHHLVGGNSFMLKLMKANKDTLGIDATDAQFDSVIMRTNDLLRLETLDMQLSDLGTANDTAFYSVRLENKAGHKFPSGYPARRAFIQFLVLDDLGDTLFKSGTWDNDYEVIGHDAQFEPHYQTIDEEDQVQIYEMIMGDVNGDRTTVLERAASHLKDNRLTPKGFSMSHPTYDTTLIAGNALTDPDFNWDGGTEGTGADIVYYNVPLNGFTGSLNVIAKVYYQSVPPGWLQEMFQLSSQPIDHFKDMFNQADKEPILIAQQSIGSLFTGVEEKEQELMVWPNPAPANGTINVQSAMVGTATVSWFTADGRKLSDAQVRLTGNDVIRLPDASGMLIMVIRQGEEQFMQRIIVR